MNDERFLDLITILEAVPENNFDMNKWRSNCGTVGCAIGHYCFQRPDAKLKIIAHKTPLYEAWIPMINGHHGAEAIAHHFGITRDDAYVLFLEPAERINRSRITKSQVLSSLIQFYNKHAKTPLPIHEVAEQVLEATIFEGALK